MLILSAVFSAYLSYAGMVAKWLTINVNGKPLVFIKTSAWGRPWL